MKRRHALAAAVTWMAAATAPAHAAQTPPMGVDPYYSHLDTKGAVDETGIEETADVLASSGMRDLGYREIALGNWWKDGGREAEGAIALDPAQWPHGIRPLTDALHARGFTVRAYTDIGPFGCITPSANSFGHYAQDAGAVAAWGIDALTVDWCGAYVNQWPPDQIQQAFTELGGDLRRDGVTLDMALYDPNNDSDNATWASKIAETYRIGQDIGALGTIDFARVLAAVDRAAADPTTTGPGHFRDPDMIVAGVGPISDEEGRLQLSMWAMLSAPLILGTDVAHMSPATRATVTNPEIVAIDQDPLVQMARKVSDDGAGQDVWVKRLADGSRAVALLNRADRSAAMATDAHALGLPRAEAYRLRDVWRHATTETTGRIAATVPAHGVAVYRVAPGRAAAPDVSVLAEPGVAEAGRPLMLAATLENHGRVSAPVDATLDLPSGWRALARTPRRLAPGARTTVHWLLLPAGGPGTYSLGIGATRADLTLAQPPKGVTALSDLPFVRTTASGWTSVERAGGVISLHAPSSADVFLGGRCSRFAATVTLDDHDAFNQPHHARLTLRVLRDGVAIAARTLESGASTSTALNLDVRGARTLRIEADDTGGYWNYAFATARWSAGSVQCA